MLGTTFNYVFEFQMEQSAVRRPHVLPVPHAGHELPQPPGAQHLRRYRDAQHRAGDKYSTHLNSALFLTPDFIIELDRGIAQEDYNGARPAMTRIGTTHPSGAANREGLPRLQRQHDRRRDPRFRRLPQVLGGDHYVLGGTEGNDNICGDNGIDTFWGDGGNDYLKGGDGVDDVFGGEGDDIIEDPLATATCCAATQGNDVIAGARARLAVRR